MNDYDRGVIRSLLLKKGFEEVAKPEESNFVIYLTCAVRKHAEQRALGRIRSEGNGKVKVVAGCLARMYGEKLIKEGMADIVIGPDSYRNLPFLLQRHIREGLPEIDIENRLDSYEDILPIFRENNFSRYITIMRGCNNFCSYCIVPYVRGSERFKPQDSILKEVRKAVEEGVVEVFLLGQNVLAYRDKEIGFTQLLEKVSQIKGLRRVGFLTSHPKDMSDELIEKLLRIENLVRYFHIPLQSGSERILKKMNRRYTPEYYLEIIESIRKRFKDPFISTDIIVGFPGETEEDFKETIEMVKRIEFDFAYMFAYSERPFTKACKMGPKVDEKTKKERLSYLIEIQNTITRKKVRSLLGKTEKVLSFGRAKRGGTLTKSLNNRIVVVEEDIEPKREVFIKIEKINGWTPIGRLKWE